MSSLPATGIALFAFQRRMSPALSIILLWHIVFGVIVSGVLIWVAAARYRRPRAREMPGVAGIGLCITTGLLMIGLAASGRSAGAISGAFYTHIVSGLAITLLGLSTSLHALHRRKSSLTAAGAIALSALALGAVSYDPNRYFHLLTAATSEQARNPLFPAGTIIERPGEWASALTSQTCGQSGCHADIASRMAVSPHAAANTLVGQTGNSGRWCAGCHNPASLRKDSDADGIDCLSCHAVSEVPERAGGGHAVLTPPESYPFARSTDGKLRAIHDFLLKVRPIPHSNSLAGPMRDPSLSCLPCHRNGLTAAQNGAGYLLYDDTWGQWQNTHYSGKSLHTFRPVSQVKSCVSCHPVHSGHGAEQTRASLARSLSLEIFAMTGAVGTRSLIDGSTVEPGRRISVDVLVRSAGIGHAFPAGSPDLKQTWIEFKVTNGSGRTLASSGSRVGSGAESVHRYGMTTLDSQGKRVKYGHKGDSAAQSYNPPTGAAQGYVPNYRAINAGEADAARYTFQVPKAEGILILAANLWYSPLGKSSKTEDPILLTSDYVDLRVSRSFKVSESRLSSDPAGLSELWYAYGIALFRQKDTSASRLAFEQSRSIRANEPEHSIAIGRTFLEEGDLLSARSQLKNALKIDPESPRARAWLGRTLRIMGQYDEALSELQPLAESHPEDAATWLDIGLCQFRLGNFEAAISAFKQVLALVPDDSGARLNLMLAYRRTMRITEARREEAIYLNLKNEGRPAPVVQRYLQDHPDDALETTPRHEHRLVLNP